MVSSIFDDSPSSRFQKSVLPVVGVHFVFTSSLAKPPGNVELCRGSLVPRGTTRWSTFLPQSHAIAPRRILCVSIDGGVSAHHPQNIRSFPLLLWGSSTLPPQTKGRKKKPRTYARWHRDRAAKVDSSVSSTVVTWVGGAVCRVLLVFCIIRGWRGGRKRVVVSERALKRAWFSNSIRGAIGCKHPVVDLRTHEKEKKKKKERRRRVITRAPRGPPPLGGRPQSCQSRREVDV